MSTDHGTTYEVRIAGQVPAEVLDELDDVLMVHQELRTVVSGSFRDQAALHGFLTQLRALGLDLVEVRTVHAGGDDKRGGPDDSGS